MGFFANLMTAIGMIPQLLSLIDQVVVNIEQGLGQIPGITGSQKFAAAEAKVNTFLKAAITDAGLLGAVQTVVKPLIDGAVAAFNAAGFFKHKTASGVQGGDPAAPGTSLAPDVAAPVAANQASA